MLLGLGSLAVQHTPIIVLTGILVWLVAVLMQASTEGWQQLGEGVLGVLTRPLLIVGVTR